MLRETPSIVVGGGGDGGFGVGVISVVVGGVVVIVVTVRVIATNPKLNGINRNFRLTNPINNPNNRHNPS